jgi:DNA anti-recombination protein RmuC
MAAASIPPCRRDEMKLAACVGITALAAALGFAVAPASADDYQDAVDRTHTEVGKFQAWVSEQTAMLKDEIDDLEEELQSSTSEDKARIDQMIQHADDLADELQDQASQIGAAASDQWAQAKASVLGGWHRTQAAYHAALAELRGNGGR